MSVTVLSLNGNSVEFDTGDVWTGGTSHCLPCDREFARDDDGDGFCEVHVNTIEGFWSLLRSLLRPYREISQEKLLARKRVLGLE